MSPGEEIEQLKADLAAARAEVEQLKSDLRFRDEQRLVAREQRDDARAELATVKAERDALRGAVLHLCTVWDSRRDQAAIMAAVRHVANDTSTPFSDEAVERYRASRTKEPHE